MKVLIMIGTLLFFTCSIKPKLQLIDGIMEMAEEAEVKLFGRHLQIETYTKEIEDMARMLAQRLDGCTSPQAKIHAINTFLFSEQVFIPELDSSSIENDSPIRILETKKGSCLGMVCLYLMITQNTHLPLHAVLVPGHTFIRYDDGIQKINIEMLRYGIERTDAFYKEHFLQTRQGRQYLRNLNSNEVIALFIFNLGNSYRKRALYEDAEKKYKTAVRLFPDFTEAFENLYGLSKISHSH
jgi:regulator of sirC expression with transglutaminase-like and TPR domain